MNSSVGSDDAEIHDATSHANDACRFFAAAAADVDPIGNTIRGLELLCSASRVLGDLKPFIHVPIEQPLRDILAATNLVTPLMAKSIPPTRVADGMGSALGLIVFVRPNLQMCQILHALALSAEIKLAACRAVLRQSGDQISREIQIHRALAQPPESFAAH